MSTKGPLEQIAVLVTRPAHQAGALCGRIESLGGQALRFPTIEIQPPADPAPVRARLERLAGYDLAIFVSPNAVQRMLDLAGGQAGVLRHLRVAVVGRGTARAVEQALGRVADIVPAGPYNSEALLALEAMQTMRGQRVVIFRGNGGRPLLGQTLAARGAEVEYVEVYRRAEPPLEHPNALEHLLASAPVRIAVATSNEGLRNLVHMAGEAAAAVRRLQLIVVSQRAVELAARLGFEQRPIVAQTASDEALVDAICTWATGQHGGEE